MLYIWNASTGDIGMLTEFDEFNMIGSVSWVEDGDILSIGTSSGEVQVFQHVLNHSCVYLETCFWLNVVFHLRHDLPLCLIFYI